MIFDTKEQKEAILQMINVSTVQGSQVERFFNLKKAVLEATVTEEEKENGPNSSNKG